MEDSGFWLNDLAEFLLILDMQKINMEVQNLGPH